MAAIRDSISPFTDSVNAKHSLTAAVNTDSFSYDATAEAPLFTGHRLPRIHEKALLAVNNTPDWLTFTLLSIVVLFTWYKIFYHRMFLQLLNAFFSMATTNQIVRDESVLLQRASLNASIISYLVGGIFLYQVSCYYNWYPPQLEDGFIRFIAFALAIAVIYSAKMLSIRFISSLFNADRASNAYIFTIFLFNMVAGLILLPVVIILAYAPSELRPVLINGAVILLAALLCYRLVRAVMIWTNLPRAPVFYLFLYLCAFEVAPLLLIRKVVLLQ